MFGEVRNFVIFGVLHVMLIVLQSESELHKPLATRQTEGVEGMHATLVFKFLSVPETIPLTYQV